MEANPVVTKHIQLLLTEKEAMMLHSMLKRLNGETLQEEAFRTQIEHALQKASAV